MYRFALLRVSGWKLVKTLNPHPSFSNILRFYSPAFSLSSNYAPTPATSPAPSRLSIFTRALLERGVLLTNVDSPFATQVRLKSKDKGGSKGKGKVTRVKFDPELFSQVVDHGAFKVDISDRLENLRDELATQFTLRTTAGVFENLQIETEDGTFSLNELGTVSQKNPNLIVVNMAALPNYIPHVKDTIWEANLNVNPQIEGTTILIPVSKITKEHRERLASEVKRRLESFRTELRDLTSDYQRRVKKKKSVGVSEDAIFITEQWLRQEADALFSVAEKVAKVKQEELLDAKRT